MGNGVIHEEEREVPDTSNSIDWAEEVKARTEGKEGSENQVDVDKPCGQSCMQGWMLQHSQCKHPHQLWE